MPRYKCLQSWTWKRQFPTCERPLVTGTVEQRNKYDSGTDLYPHMPILRPRAARYSTNGASL